MTNQSTARPFRLRKYRLDDIPTFTHIINRTFPDEPTTVENMEHGNGFTQRTTRGCATALNGRMAARSPWAHASTRSG